MRSSIFKLKLEISSKQSLSNINLLLNFDLFRKITLTKLSFLKLNLIYKYIKYKFEDLL